MPLIRDQSHSFFVKRDESISTEPAPLMSNRSIGEITARFQRSQTSQDRSSIHLYVFGIVQRSYGRTDFV